MAKIIILGAGLTGLSTAYHLEQLGFYDYKIFEKESQIGGLCRSVYQDGFTFDYTGHLLHINNDYFKNIIKNTVGFNNLNNITRKSFIYSHDRYTPYPYQTNLYGLPKEVILDCITGFINRKKNRTKKTEEPHAPNNSHNNSHYPPHNNSYYHWVLKNFGAGFGKHFFFPYQQKIFSHNVRKLSSTWTNRFVPKTSLRQVICGALEQNKYTIGYNKQFFYPKSGGIYDWVKKFSQQIQNPIHTNFCAKTIDLKEKVVIFQDTHKNKHPKHSYHTEQFDILINTIPLDTLLKNIKEPAAISLKKQNKKLLCNQVINFNLGIFSPNTYDKHWIYYPEKKYPFYRTGFYHNFSRAMAPKGCSALYGEFSCLKKSKQYIANKLDFCLKEAKKVLKISDNDILTQKIIHIPHAYVIYDFWRDKNLPHIHKILNQYNIHSVGRYGEWKYASMQEAILDGQKIANKLISDTSEGHKSELENYKKNKNHHNNAYFFDKPS
ncbi:protoporphyrinogen/coproporphyrinogen oxidase [Candidatus Dependentiae bacterium]